MDEFYYTTGWQNPLAPEEVEANNRWLAQQQRDILMWRIRDKERNMMNRLERRRAAIRGKWIERGKGALTVLGLMIAIPLVATAIALAWNALWKVVL